MSTALFVGNLDPKTSKRELEAFFSPTGGVLSVRIPLDRESGTPRGFGFVDFSSREAAERALRDLDGATLGGRRLRLKWAIEKAPRPAPKPAAAAPPAEELDALDWDGGLPPGLADDSAGRRARPKRGGKHGSDRKHRQGQRRFID